MTDDFFCHFLLVIVEKIYLVSCSLKHHLRLPLSHRVSNTPNPLFARLRFFRTFYLLFIYEYLLFFVCMYIVFTYVYCLYILFVYMCCVYTCSIYTYIYSNTYLCRLNISYHCVISSITDKYYEWCKLWDKGCPFICQTWWPKVILISLSSELSLLFI